MSVTIEDRMEEVEDIEELEQRLYTREYIEEEYLRYCFSHEYLGWVEATIERFSIEDGELKMHFSVPYCDDPGTFGWDIDDLETSYLSNVCHEYGLNVKDFRLLEGETLWLRVKSLDIEGGEVVDETHTMTKRGDGLKEPLFRGNKRKYELTFWNYILLIAFGWMALILLL